MLLILNFAVRATARNSSSTSTTTPTYNVTGTKAAQVSGESSIVWVLVVCVCVYARARPASFSPLACPTLESSLQATDPTLLAVAELGWARALAV
jgi:hypothetical protein